MKLLQMGKDIVSLLPHTKYRGTLFVKKALHGETNLFRQIYGRMFYTGNYDQIMQGGRLMVKRFQSSSQVSFPLI